MQAMEDEGRYQSSLQEQGDGNIYIDNTFAPPINRGRTLFYIGILAVAIFGLGVVIRNNSSSVAFRGMEMEEISSEGRQVSSFDDVDVYQSIALNAVGERFELFSTKSEDQKKLLWHEFKQLFGKDYPTMEEEKEHFDTFLDNMEHIDNFNRNSKGAKYGITKFSDVSRDTFKNMLTLRMDPFSSMIHTAKNIVDFIEHGFKAKHPVECPACHIDDVKSSIESGKLPASFDWRDYGVVTEVKNQMFCGNCWAWAAAGDIEGTWALAGNDLVSVSTQEMTSCATASDCCEGGMMSFGFEYVIQSGGIMTESEYPFEDGMGECTACRSNQVLLSESAAHISSWTMIKGTGDELRKQLISMGPISIGINALPMQFYQGGVDAHEDCDPAGLDHGVLLVGYGTSQNGDKYWTIKNSWGPDWGESGYYRISERFGACGIGEISMKSIA